MGYDIPDNLDLSSMGEASDSAPAPAPTGDAGQPADSGTAPTSLTYDPNMPISYKASGKELQEPLSAVIQRAQRGYDYAQLVQQHKQQVAETQAQWDQRQQQIQQMEANWKPYHDFAQQNPEWAEHVRQSWDNRFNSMQQSTQQQQFSPQEQEQQQQSLGEQKLPPHIQRELAEVRQFMSDMKNKEAAAQQAAQDNALAQEIDGIKKNYPDVDFRHTDPETGESLEARVLRHAQENRIYNFSAAFKDFYFDKLMERNVIRAKEEVARTMQQKTKQGFLGQSNVPLMNQGQSPDLRRMSYNQLMDVAAKEMGL